ncbi:hypothetical protein E2562_014966 [Oryza meyeriana var. granulata]|uniref:Uncharacterized protein n=1 Tax=Oryza meyeriana var. granulata TaxID=110450 RepID=A0A6G1EKE5_9ORYZ|nr:hypothetical protein E2562_014966 [Oryza meyeriana var. granulata]
MIAAWTTSGSVVSLSFGSNRSANRTQEPRFSRLQSVGLIPSSSASAAAAAAVSSFSSVIRAAAMARATAVARDDDDVPPGTTSTRRPAWLPAASAELMKASAKTEVYSLGVIILELLTGKSELTNCMDLPQWVASIVKEWTSEMVALSHRRADDEQGR